MTRAALLVLLLPVALVGAAPVPPPGEKERIATLWGKAEGGGKFELNGRQLVLRADGDATHPRVTRTVRGDFVAEAAVAEAACPDATKGDSQNPQSQAGLSVTGDGYSFSIHLYQLFNRGDDKQFYKDPQRCVWVDGMHRNGGGGTMLKDMEKRQSVRLRVTRTGKALTAAYSLDGKEWTTSTAETDKLDFPDEVTVGLFLSHTTHQALHAAFDTFTVEKPKK